MNERFYSWQQAEIDVNPRGNTDQKLKCPRCTHSRKNKNDKSLSVNIDKRIWTCHNCGWSGCILDERMKREYPPVLPKGAAVSQGIINWVASRGIEERVLTAFKVTESNEWMPAKGDYPAGQRNCILFNYYRDGKIVNRKYRDGAKCFKMEKDAELIFYNLDALRDKTECTITEGEFDCMAFYQAGVYSAISVPNGASKGNQRLEYLDNCYEAFEKIEKIYLATDGDEPGRALLEELARRLGKSRCFIVTYPEDCKDANEVLMKHGEKAVRQLLLDAQPFPVEGVDRVSNFAEKLSILQRDGFPAGVKLGYPRFDELMTYHPGELTLISGFPNSGKSEFLDEICVRLAARGDWKIGICSPEKQPTEVHISSLWEKMTGYSFFAKPPTAAPARLSYQAYDFLEDHFFFMKLNEIEMTGDGILEKAKEMVLRFGINALVIDPYNYIEHKMKPGQNETQYISELLTKFTAFCKLYKVHVFLVAHPAKPQKQKDNDGNPIIPTPYEIAGSANFFNKADNILWVFRHKGMPDGGFGDLVEVFVQKVRFKWVGKLGSSQFHFHLPTSRYKECIETSFDYGLRMINTPHEVIQTSLLTPDTYVPHKLNTQTDHTANFDKSVLDQEEAPF